MLATTVLMAAICGIASAAAKPPTALFLRSELLPEQAGKEAFDKLYMSIQLLQDLNVVIPVFAELNADAMVFNLANAVKPEGGSNTLYNLVWNEGGINDTFIGTMVFQGDLPDADWQPVSLLAVDGELVAGQSQSRFYLNGTGRNMTLSWESVVYHYLPPFHSWLLCKWAYQSPQLFFTTGVALNPIPETCAHVDLKVIPVPNSD